MAHLRYYCSGSRCLTVMSVIEGDGRLTLPQRLMRLAPEQLTSDDCHFADRRSGPGGRRNAGI